MARGKKAAATLTPEEKLQQALVPVEEQSYEIPENWCWTYIGKIISVSSGKGLTAKKMNSEGTIPVYGGNGITGYHDASTVDGTTIVIGRVGAYCGCVHYIEGEAWVTDNALLVDFDSTKFSYRYLYWLLTNTDLRKNDSSSAQPVISGSKIYDLTIPVAPFAEQQRIVDRIESIYAKLDEAKEKAQAVVDGFELRKSAILHKAFTGELTAQWRQEHGIERDSWEVVTLSDVCKVNPKKLDTKELPDNLEVSFFPMPALSEIYGEITDPQTRPLKEVRSGFTNFSEGDVVFAKITPCMENGKSAVIGKLVNDIGFGTTEFYVFRCGNKLYNRYLYHLVRDQHFRDEAKAVMTGAVGQQRVPKSFLEDYPLNLPSVPEQEVIANMLDDMFSKEMKVKDTAEAVIDQIDTMKKAVLARAFRGELGTNDPAEESAMELLKSVL